MNTLPSIPTVFTVKSPDGFELERGVSYYNSVAEAALAVDLFVDRYRHQGYYSSVNRERIPLDLITSHCELTAEPASNFHSHPVRNFQPCPEEIREQVMADNRTDDFAEGAIWGWIRYYVTDCPGYVGPLIYISWPADPGALSIYRLGIVANAHEAWLLTNQTKW